MSYQTTCHMMLLSTCEDYSLETQCDHVHLILTRPGSFIIYAKDYFIPLFTSNQCAFDYYSCQLGVGGPTPSNLSRNTLRKIDVPVNCKLFLWLKKIINQRELPLKK